MPNKKDFNCKKCREKDNDRMVQCDNCNLWFHYDCVGVNNDVADISWSCVFCNQPSIVTTMSPGAPSTACRTVNNAPEPSATSSPVIDSQTISSKTDDAHMELRKLQRNLETEIVCTSTSSQPSGAYPKRTVEMQQITTIVPSASSSTLAATGMIYTTSSYGSALGLRQQEMGYNLFNSYVPPNVPFIPATGPSTMQFNSATSNATIYPRYSDPFLLPNASQHQPPLQHPLQQQMFMNIPNADQLQMLPNAQMLSKAQTAVQNEYANLQSFDSRARQYELQLKLLEEENIIKKEYLEKKYQILEQLGSCTSAALPVPQLNLNNTIQEMRAARTPNPTPEQLAARHAIPKNLPTFQGDPEEWPMFISSFETSTEVAGYSHAENLMRLQTCLKGKAREMVRHKLLLPAMVPEIIQTLKMCFGRPEFIIDSMIERAKKMSPLKDRLEALIEYALCVKNICSTMEACKMHAHLNNPLLVKEFVDKLPGQYKLNWVMQFRDETVPIVKAFSDWIYYIAEAASKVTPPVSMKKNASMNTHTRAGDEETARSTTSNVPGKTTCAACESKDHRIAQCEEFKNFSIDRKWQIVKNKKLCRQCLNAHKRRCYINRECGINNCKAKHHRLLHNNTVTTQVETQIPSGNTNNAENQTDASRQVQVNSHGNSDQCEKPYFRIIAIRMHYENKYFDTFAFLDEGSSVTLVEKAVFNYLGVDGIKDPLCLRWTGDTTRNEDDSIRASLQVSNTQNGKMFTLNNAHTVDSLGLPQQSVNMREIAKKFPYLSRIPLQSYENVKPTVLIGADNWNLAVPLKILEGTWEQPIATKTRLGWAIQGRGPSKNTNLFLNIHVCDCDDRYNALHETVKQYFSLEAPAKKEIMSPDDARAMKILNETCQKKNDRFECGLLWRRDEVQLPNSYNTALKRLMCLNKKFAKDSTLKPILQKQIDNLLAKGYAKKISVEELSTKNERVWYLPIFVTMNPNKPGKVRLVWDAAAKSDGASLNDFLLPGPDFLSPLVGVLLSFRVGQVGVCGDIEEMFHQIRVKSSDIHAQRFLWWDKGNTLQQPSVYVMQALSFGISCAPCIAHFVRDKNADGFQDVYPRAVDAIKKYHYVDDFIDSADGEEEALQLAMQVKEIHHATGFNIRNWASNSEYVRKQLFSDSPEKQMPLEMGSTEKILGMYWDPNTDVFKYIFRFARLRHNILKDQSPPTKREVLQVLMSIFDPMGFISCYTIGLKILLQDVWRSSITWDDQLTDSMHNKWLQWKQVLPLIAKVEVPRCFSPLLRNAVDVQLHTFVDAGEYGYAAVSYLRLQYANNVDVSLVAAKSKVAPLKPLSIPRSELQAAIIGVRLSTTIFNVERISINSRHWWSDSKTVLKWLRMDPSELLEHTNISQWHWVPSKLNPADLATKVTAASTNQLWFRGPAFLQSEGSEWPACRDLGPDDTSELRHHVMFVDKKHLHQVPVNFNYFSNWRRLYRSVATFCLYMARVKAKATLTAPPKIISYDMTQRAKIFLYKQAQLSAYEDEIFSLKSGKNIQQTSSLISLDVFLDENEVLRLRSRAECLNSNYNVIILPTSHRITSLIVQYYHESFHHMVHEVVISKVNGLYRIPRLRVLYKTIREQCQYCKNLAARPIAPQLGRLPAARLGSFERPFTYVGIDFFGPLFVAVGRRREKRWGVVFTCLTMRAIHIEVAHSLDTSSCIMCVCNFMARRGTPKEILTDNGTNFKATEKIVCEEIKNIDYDIVSGKCDTIKWRFNPPAAPHMGGAWERLVRSVKTVLHSICPSMNFNDESLRSALWEIEFIINSRPLTFVSLDSADDEAITPNHLLLGSASGYKPICSAEGDLRQRWRQTQIFADKFWQRWLKEYVPMLARRSKWFVKTPPISVGDVVIVVDENLPRNCWPKGIITDTIVARDGQVRRVTIKTQKTTMHRPATKVAVLDVGKKSE